MWFLLLQKWLFMSHIPLQWGRLLSVENLEMSQIFTDRETKTWDSCDVDMYKNIHLVHKLNLSGWKHPKYWIAIHYFPSACNSFQFRSNLIHPQVRTKGIHVCLAHNRPLVVSSSEFHSKSLSSMDGWQILQIQPTLYRLKRWNRTWMLT